MYTTSSPYQAVSNTNDDTLKNHTITTNQDISVEKSGPASRKSTILAWWPEFLAWVSAAAIIAAIIAVLHTFNGAAVEEWRSRLTLNAFLSLLVTLLYTALSVTIPKCISQLKWNHFASKRPLADLVIFDDASRSVWGSVVLIVKRPSRLLAVFGAFLVLVVAAVGPFVQQILTQRIVSQLRSSSDATPTLPVFNWTSPYSGNLTAVNTTLADDPFDTSGNGQPSIGEFRRGEYRWLPSEATYDGLTARGPQNYPVDVHCTYSNCTWDPFWTLVIESECRNVTSLLQTSTNDTGTDFRLPNGFGIFAPGSVSDNDTTATSISGLQNFTADASSLFFAERGHILLNFFILYQGSDWISAEECMFQYRARQMRASYSLGTLSETPIGPSVQNNTEPARNCSPWQDTRTAPDLTYNSTCNISISTSPNEEDSALFFPSSYLTFASHQIANMFILPDQQANWYSFSAFSKFSTAFMATNAAHFSVPDDFGFVQDPTDYSNFTTLDVRVANVAASLTQALRNEYFSSQILVQGTAYRNVLIYNVRWEWISLPAGLALGTLLLLILTVGDTRRKGGGKRGDSVLALIASGGNGGVGRVIEELGGDLERIGEVAKGLKVRLGPDGALRC